MELEMYQKAKNCWFDYSNSHSMLSNHYDYGNSLIKIIDSGDLEIPRLGELDQTQRVFWENLARIMEIERPEQIELFLKFIKKQIPPRFLNEYLD